MDMNTYLSHISQHCGLEESDISVSIEEDDETISVQLNVPADDVGLFIGNKGETLASFQRMLRIVFGEEHKNKRIVLNINDYRQERQRQLEERALEAAQQVLDSGDSYRFPYLSSYERFVVHSAISKNDDFKTLKSASEGVGRDRRLVIRSATDIAA